MSGRTPADSASGGVRLLTADGFADLPPPQQHVTDSGNGLQNSAAQTYSPLW